MIALLLGSVIAAQSASIAEQDCRAVVDSLEVRRAVRAGQVRTIIEASELVDQCAGREELLVLAAQTAWEELDFDATALLASSALRLVGDRNCAWTPLAARLAFVTGFSRRANNVRGASFYFYVAKEVHRAAGGLNRSWQRIAHEFGEDFGTFPPDDIFAFGSPYIERPYQVDEAACNQLPDFHIRFDGIVDHTAVAVFDMRSDNDGDIRRARQILSYPGPIHGEIERALHGRRTHYRYTDGYRMLVFRPCLDDSFFDDDGPSVCVSDPSAGEHHLGRAQDQ